MLVTIKDDTLGGSTIHSVEVDFSSEELTVREIIQERVESEVYNYNKKSSEVFNGLIQPTDKETRLNNKKQDRKLIDAEKQVYTALDAFTKNGFFVLIDNLQVEDLEQKVKLKADTEISFIKLTPLVGG